MASMKRRLDQLQRKVPDAEHHDPATAEALKSLTDDELEHLDGALYRGFDPQRPDDVPLSPDEWAAFERFNEFYEEARRRGG